ncbi:hypothetical protein F8M41_014998 [Gigaspora margarita]|uniref:Uncharacterized protein n=1 Tax=Gigaspora margarita TaxID=4874 RepID=A0A8H4B3G7_GIGMA|nr:hypothetical protein F8M41_014998 [Gigaspora margarita]
MNQKLFILLLAVMFFGGLVPSINALPAPAPNAATQCPNPAPFCDDTEVCIFNTNTQSCTCSCCDSQGKNCKQNFP